MQQWWGLRAEADGLVVVHLGGVAMMGGEPEIERFVFGRRAFQGRETRGLLGELSAASVNSSSPACQSGFGRGAVGSVRNVYLVSSVSK